MKGALLILDKDAGMTSHDVVNCVRRIFNTKKVGHTGTLDPDATGVLPIVIGQATRLAEYMTAEDKAYIAEMQFGLETDTQDISGQVIKTCAYPNMDAASFSQIISRFQGEQTQITPMYSAVKYKGRPLYEWAREGYIFDDLPQRHIRINQLTVKSYSSEKAEIHVHCSKGTYIRTLCVDIGRACDSGAAVSALRRISCGPFTLDHAVTLAELRESAQPESYFINVLEGLTAYPKILIDDAQASEIRLGGRIRLSHDAGSAALALACVNDDLLAVGKIEDDLFLPKKVFL